MGIACWPAARDGRYWIDVALGNLELPLVVDTGLSDTRHWLGFQVDPAIYDQLKRTGQFVHIDHRTWRDASGRSTRTEAGLTSAQLIDPVSRRRVGPVVRVYVNRGAPKVPNRVGLAFFHRLHGCRVLWELDSRTWCVEYP
jgi:hypothetical protein